MYDRNQPAGQTCYSEDYQSAGTGGSAGAGSSRGRERSGFFRRAWFALNGDFHAIYTIP